MCFPRGFTGLEFGEKEGDLIRSFIRQILSIYFVSGTLKGFHRAFGGGEGEAVSPNVLYILREVE